MLPDDAGIPVAVTDAEKAALTAFLAWAHQLWDHDAALVTRVDKTATWCAAP